MSNVAGKAYAMNVVTPMRPALTWINRLRLHGVACASRHIVGIARASSLIHFARWVMIRRDQWPERGQRQQNLQPTTTCCSAATSTAPGTNISTPSPTALPGGLDLFWYSSTKYPQLDPDHAVQELHPRQSDRHQLLLQRDAGQRAARHQGGAERWRRRFARSTPAARMPSWRPPTTSCFSTVQGGLGAPGYAPVASCDTTAADVHRCVAVRERWGPHGEGPPPAEHLLHAVAPEIIAGRPATKPRRRRSRRRLATSWRASRESTPRRRSPPPARLHRPAPRHRRRPPPRRRLRRLRRLRPPIRRSPMPNLDGGHYFFTALVPICNVGIVQHEAMKSSPIHMVREALETLPTALQSHVTGEDRHPEPVRADRCARISRGWWCSISPLQRPRPCRCAGLGDQGHRPAQGRSRSTRSPAPTCS